MGNNKSMKILCYAVVTAMTFTSIVGPVNASAAKKAKVAKKTLTITEGKSRKIVIKNKKSKAKYLFKASNAKIKVTKKGKVTAVKAGKAKVTVTEKLKKKTRKIGVVTVKVKAKKTVTPTNAPVTTVAPTTAPTVAPTAAPTVAPSVAPASEAPTVAPTEAPTVAPSEAPTVAPSEAPTAAPSANPEATVVYNNYFEDGDMKGITARGGCSVEISQSQNHTEGGMNSLLCTGRSANWHGASLALSTIAEAGSNYEFSAWVKQDTGSAQDIGLKLQYTDSAGNTQYKSVISGVQAVTCESGT